MGLLLLFRFFFFFIFGLCIGSFLNVAVWRLPLKLPIAHGARSMCPKCGHELHALDLVPVFSFLFLKGKCRYCGAPISARYPGVELLTGILFGLSALKFDFSLYAVLLCVFFSMLIVASFIDIDHTWIPDRVPAVILILAVWSWFCGPSVSLTERLIGGLGVGLFMLLLSLFTGGGIGLGDVKLMASSGLLLGWKLIVPAFFLAYIFALLFWLPSIVKKKVRAHSEVCMGPFFSAALVLMSLVGNEMITWYLGLF